MSSIRAQMFVRDVKKLLDLLLITKNKDDLITIHGTIRLKLEMIRRLLDDKAE